MYAIAFDLKIDVLKTEYGDPYNKAYDEIRQELEALNFNWTQGSVYISNSEKDSLTTVYKAKQLGVKKVISRVSNTTNANLFERVGIDVTISSKTASLNEIKNNLCGTNVSILATVEQGQGEVSTVLLPKEFQPQKLMNIKLPKKGIIGIIQRRNRIIIPNGATEIMGEDNLIIFTKSENVQAIREYFKVG